MAAPGRSEATGERSTPQGHPRPRAGPNLREGRRGPLSRRELALGATRRSVRDGDHRPPRREIFPADVAASLAAHDATVLRTGRALDIEEPIAVGDSLRVVRAIKFPLLGPDGRPDAVGGITIDVTEERSLREQLIVAQKMEAVAQLGGGVAHDFNNLMTVVRGYADLVRTQLAPDDALRGDLDEIAGPQIELRRSPVNCWRSVGGSCSSPGPSISQVSPKDWSQWLAA